MSDPLFTASGNKVRISGNTNEKTRCGEIKVYDDRMEIQQKGTFRSKGYITVMFSDINSISVSSKAAGSKLHVVTESNDYKVSMFHSSGEKPSETVDRIRGLIREVQSSPTEVSVTGGDGTGGNSVAEEIEKLADLNDRGVLTDEEFEKKKNELL